METRLIPRSAANLQKLRGCKKGFYPIASMGSMALPTP
jgi:hypothetical protein